MTLTLRLARDAELREGAPPSWIGNRCAVGEPGLPGCRSCVEICPYSAVRALDRPGGTLIDIDPELCRRCGACTGVCPTSALQRLFSSDADIRDAIEAAIGNAGFGGVLVFACEAGRARWEAAAKGRAPVFVTLPTILILNENHLLFSLRSGAQKVVVSGCLECHHGRPDILETPLRLAATLAGDVSRFEYVEDEYAAPMVGLIDDRNSPQQRQGSSASIRSAAPPNATRRAVLLDLLADFMAPIDGPAAPFADVTARTDDCTLCGACARVCPTNALMHYPEKSSLEFLKSECVACSLCVQACPTDALEVHPGLTTFAELQEPRVLVEDTPALCSQCGKPYAAERLLNHAKQLLAGKGGVSLRDAQITLCGECRSVTRNRTPEGIGRRSFLTASAAAAFAAGSTATARAATTRAAADTTPARLGMVIDLNRCIGCHACTAACKAENNVPLGVFRDWVEEHVVGDYPHAMPFFLPKLCNHCDNPGCMRACPTGAIYKRDDGIVELDHDLCIGCRACNQACPYGAAFMDPVRGTSDKCNLCSHRVDEGYRPACVDVCPSQCRIFGDLDDPDSAPSQALRAAPPSVLRPELGLGPNVVYLGLPGELNR